MSKLDPKWFRAYPGECYVHENRPRGQLAPEGLEWRGACFSDDRSHRFELRRTWDPKKPHVCFIGLNPSKADAMNDDATVRLWRGFAKRWGYGGFIAVNAYTLVSTSPRGLLTAKARTADWKAWRAQLLAAAREARITVACWGGNVLPSTAAEIRRLLTMNGIRLHAIGVTQFGTPRHPRGVKADSLPILLWDRDETWTPEAQKALEALQNDLPGK